MIQRIQTLFLLLGAISAGFISMNLLGIWEHFAFAIAALVSLIIIFLYKKRKLQISLSTWLVLPLYATGIIIILFFSKGHYDESQNNTPLIISFFVEQTKNIAEQAKNILNLSEQYKIEIEKMHRYVLEQKEKKDSNLSSIRWHYNEI